MSNQQVEELRLALVMNGGVSLAVWMGGVTNEIFRLIKKRHPVYTGLLALTHTEARVDVISGTSAGGVNGAALAIALVYDGDFSQLRDVWMTMGSFDELLRPPVGPNPGSLLRGDDYFLPQIYAAFEKLSGNDGLTPCSNSPKFSEEEMPIDLRLTTTLLRGRPAYTVDDLGAQVGDIDHRARFRFRHTVDQHDFASREQLVGSLARAARSTASFPFAFEPSGVQRDAQNATPNLVDVTDSDLPLPRYVIDGGILDNKPFRGALQSIFEMKTQRSVRRVLAYVNPDPGNDPDKTSAQPAARRKANPMPELAPVLVASVFGIPQSQTVADQLDEIRAHNHEVRIRRNDVLELVQSQSLDLMALAQSVFSLYRKRRIADTFEIFVYSLFPDAAAKPAAARTAAKPALAEALNILGKNGREAIRLKFEAMKWDGWIPAAWPSQSDAPECSNSKAWEWGLFPVDFAAKVLLNLLRLTQRLQDYVGLRGRNAPYTASPAVMGRDDLTPLWIRAYALVDEITKRRDDEDKRWLEEARLFLEHLHERADAHPGVSPADLCIEQDFVDMFAFVMTSMRRQACAQFAYGIAGVICQVCPISLRVVDKLAGEKLNDSDRAQANGVSALAHFLCPLLEMPGQGGQSDPGAGPCDARDALYRVLQLEVIEYAFNDRDSLNEDALIELVQFSGNSASPIGGNTQAKEKLLGLQLAHFAAFYKQSWRANDWIYGRLDGAERLIKILLNPERLQRVYNDLERAAEDVEDIAFNSVSSARLKALLQDRWDKKYRKAIRQELAFLSHAGSALPDMLPICAEAVTLRLHYEILQEDIRGLYDAILDDQAAGADSTGPGEACRRKLEPCTNVDPEQAGQALKDGLIGAERLIDEAGSDLFTRTFAHTSATLQNTLASKSAKLGPLSALFASLRMPILGFYFVARGLTHQSRTSAALNGGILAVGAVIVAMQFLWSEKTLGEQSPSTAAHLIVSVGWALFAYGLLVSILRAPRTIGVGFFAACAVAIITAFLLEQSAVWILLIAVLSILFSVRFVWLQWVVGIAAIVGAGLFGSGHLTSDRTKLASLLPWAKHAATPDTSDAQRGIVLLSVIVALAILLAMWQMTHSSKKLEAWTGRLLRRMASVWASIWR